jgi:hypothetical protein
VKLLKVNTTERENQSEGLKNISEQLHSLANASKTMTRQQNLLKSLIYQEMKERHDIIHDAHQSSLHWLFEELKTDYVKWLERGSGIFWVNGKVSYPDFIF